MKDKRHELIRDFFEQNERFLKQGEIIKAGFPDSKNPRNLAMKRMYQDETFKPDEFEKIVDRLKDLKGLIENFINEAEKI